MDNIRTSELPTSNTIAKTDTVVANVGNDTKKVTVSAILNNFDNDPIGHNGTALSSSTNLNDVYTNGVYYATDSNATTITNKPDGLAGYFKLIVMDTGSHKVQIIFNYNPNDTVFNIWHRCRINSSQFTAWETGGSGSGGSGFDPIGSNGTELAANANLNSLTAPGVYYATSTNASTITGKPDDVSGAFKLLILRTGTTSGYQAQILFGYVNNVTLTIWYRGASSNNTYTVWYTAGGGGGTNYATRIDNYSDLRAYVLAIPGYGVAPFKITGSLASTISGGAITSDFYGFVTRDSNTGSDNIYADFSGTYRVTDTSTTPTTYHTYGAHVRCYLNSSTVGSVVFCNKVSYDYGESSEDYSDTFIKKSYSMTHTFTVGANSIGEVRSDFFYPSITTPEGYIPFSMNLLTDVNCIIPYQYSYHESSEEQNVVLVYNTSSQTQSFFLYFDVIYIKSDYFSEAED